MAFIFQSLFIHFTFNFLRDDAFTYEDYYNPKVRALLRFPPEERRYIFTYTNQDLIAISSKDAQFVANASKVLQRLKAPKFIRTTFRDYQPLLSTGVRARHRFAEGIHIRWKQIGGIDEPLIASLYMPTGWILMLIVTYLACIVLSPMIGAFLVHTFFTLLFLYKTFLWGPVKSILRWFLIREQLSYQRSQKRIAPSYFLEPRNTWKIPYFLRHDNIEDVPCELAYKLPINKIDYTRYILTEEDYDEMDLGMDELEYIDDLLQFRDENPKAVAALLKHRLGIEKFYYYFDEDILSDESDLEEEKPPMPEQPVEGEGVGERETDRFAYLKILDYDEPWMHEEYDAKFTGPLYQLEEIQKRRQIIKQLKEDVMYFHNLIVADDKYDHNLGESTSEDRLKAQIKAMHVMNKFNRFSNITKERIAEIEPSQKTQLARNVALSKYLPLTDQMSHYNHRLNLKHEKQKDAAKRKVQLEIFGGP